MHNSKFYMIIFFHFLLSKLNHYQRSQPIITRFQYLVYASPYKLIIEKGVVNDFNKIPSELEINTYLNQNNFTSCRTAIFQPTIFTGLT